MISEFVIIWVCNYCILARVGDRREAVKKMDDSMAVHYNAATIPEVGRSEVSGR
jgi:hypothetical protein